jgi:hypothetical protein
MIFNNIHNFLYIEPCMISTCIKTHCLTQYNILSRMEQDSSYQTEYYCGICRETCQNRKLRKVITGEAAKTTIDKLQNFCLINFPSSDLQHSLDQLPVRHKYICHGCEARIVKWDKLFKEVQQITEELKNGLSGLLPQHSTMEGSTGTQSMVRQVTTRVPAITPKRRRLIQGSSPSVKVRCH